MGDFSSPGEAPHIFCIAPSRRSYALLGTGSRPLCDLNLVAAFKIAFVDASAFPNLVATRAAFLPLTFMTSTRMSSSLTSPKTSLSFKKSLAKTAANDMSWLEPLLAGSMATSSNDDPTEYAGMSIFDHLVEDRKLS
jgi:hypothetical protein